MTTSAMDRTSGARQLVGATPHGSRPRQVVTTLAIVAGAAMVAWSAWLHYYLWSHYDYKVIHLLGVAFLAQAIAGFAIAVALVAFRRLVTVALGALYCAASAGALVLSATVGFLGVHDDFATPYAGLAFATEVVGFVVLVGASAAMLRR
jgi:hypothetical protein